MADTLQNIKLTANTWIDLYAITGIDSGVQIAVQNIGTCDVYLSSNTTQPTSEESTQILARGVFLKNDQGDSEAWAYCQSSSGLINVRIV